MILHHIQTSATSDNALNTCLRYIQAADSILLADDAINALLYQHLRQQLMQYQVFVLQDDVQARGLQEKIDSLSQVQVTIIDYNEFVAQSLQHSKVITW